MNPHKVITTQKVTIAGTSAAVTNAFGTSTTVVRIVCTSDTHITFAATPTATTSHMLMTANTPEYFAAVPGQKVAGIQSSTGGTMYVTEMTK